jgi:hypothetical protein
MRIHEMIWAVGFRGHVARDQHFSNSRAGEVKGERCRNSRYAKSRNDLGCLITKDMDHWSDMKSESMILIAVVD